MLYFILLYFIWISQIKEKEKKYCELKSLKIYSLVGNIKNDLVTYFMQHIRNGLIIDLINSWKNNIC